MTAHEGQEGRPPADEPPAPRRGRGVGVKVGIAAATVTLVAALVAGALLTDRLTPAPVALPNPVPVVVPVTATTTDQVTAVPIKVAFNTPVQAVVRRPGIVTDVRTAAQRAIKNGAVIARIDGRPVVAMVAPVAPYRDLRVGDRGSDVKDLQIWLRSLKFLTARPDDRFGAATRSAVQRWQRSIGEKPTGRFELASVIWVGKEAGSVAELLLTAGRSVSEADALLTVSARVRAIEVSEPPEGIRQTGDQVLTVGEVSVPYTPGSGVISEPKAAKRIRSALGTTIEGIGRVRSKTPLTVKLLPASAVVADATGHTCVFPTVDGPPVPVEPLSGGLGGVAVAEDTPVTAVLANPSLVRDDLSCT